MCIWSLFLKLNGKILEKCRQGNTQFYMKEMRGADSQEDFVSSSGKRFCFPGLAALH